LGSLKVKRHINAYSHKSFEILQNIRRRSSLHRSRVEDTGRRERMVQKKDMEDKTCHPHPHDDVETGRYTTLSLSLYLLAK
jgi:hypothetical protein